MTPDEKAAHDALIRNIGKALGMVVTEGTRKITFGGGNVAVFTSGDGELEAGSAGQMGWPVATTLWWRGGGDRAPHLQRAAWKLRAFPGAPWFVDTEYDRDGQPENLNVGVPYHHREWLLAAPAPKPRPIDDRNPRVKALVDRVTAHILTAGVPDVDPEYLKGFLARNRKALGVAIVEAGLVELVGVPGNGHRKAARVTGAKPGKVRHEVGTLVVGVYGGFPEFWRKASATRWQAVSRIGNVHNLPGGTEKRIMSSPVTVIATNTPAGKTREERRALVALVRPHLPPAETAEDYLTGAVWVNPFQHGIHYLRAGHENGADIVRVYPPDEDDEDDDGLYRWQVEKRFGFRGISHTGKAGRLADAKRDAVAAASEWGAVVPPEPEVW